MQGRLQEKISPDQDSASEAEMSRDLQPQLRLSDDPCGFCEPERKETMKGGEYEEEEEDEEEEFSFMCGEGGTSPIAAEDAFFNGKIRPFFPLFNQELFESRPANPPVNKVFVETTSSGTRNNDILGRCCEWSNRKAVEVSPETCRKSNSTGFSKLWRFKELMERSNSDGRDTFVFLNNVDVDAPPPAAGVKARKRGNKTASLSAHELYLKSKARGEEKRRSYLPYRPELMGFFTNASGLSKNVHPF